MKFDKNKVYTAANADSLRTGSMGYHADNLEALKKRVSSEVNKEYGMLTEILDEGCSYRFRINDIMDNALFYLVEEPKIEEFRSYNDVNEMIEDFNNHFNIIPIRRRPPIMWVKFKADGSAYLITRYTKDRVTLCLEDDVCTFNLKVLAEDYTWYDGSPCGIKKD